MRHVKGTIMLTISCTKCGKVGAGQHHYDEIWVMDEAKPHLVNVNEAKKK
jgi:hypothetical protein